VLHNVDCRRGPLLGFGRIELRQNDGTWSLSFGADGGVGHGCSEMQSDRPNITSGDRWRFAASPASGRIRTFPVNRTRGRTQAEEQEPG
jgi:hypothetical protein